LILKGENFKSTIFVKNQFHSPLGFLSKRQTFCCAIPTIGIRACFDSYSNFSKMVGQNQTFVEGASINRPPLFTSENYPFWKVRCKFF